MRTHLEQEGRRLLDAVDRHEGVDDNVQIDEGTGRELLRKLERAPRVRAHKVLQHERVVAAVVRLGRVGDNLVVLTLLNEAVDRLLGHIRAQVHGERHVHVGLRDEVAELLRALELVIGEPLLEQLRAALLQHGTRELHGLHLIELSLLEQRVEVLKHGLR